ncbi:hypothetical protein ACQ33O_01325 [Ferruginibacter sp. SUN002]|uniref:hypothetical protein n=1 Tax=Ferruginibacter sp. SUN002 TaxID=2937789 RepID=UPI003D36E615
MSESIKYEIVLEQLKHRLEVLKDKTEEALKKMGGNTGGIYYRIEGKIQGSQSTAKQKSVSLKEKISNKIDDLKKRATKK